MGGEAESESEAQTNDVFAFLSWATPSHSTFDSCNQRGGKGGGYERLRGRRTHHFQEGRIQKLASTNSRSQMMKNTPHNKATKQLMGGPTNCQLILSYHMEV